MPQIFFLSIGPPWVFSSRTGKICTFKRLRFYIYFMPYVLLNQTPQLLPQNRRNDRGKSVEGLVFQAGLCFARERHLVASQRPAIGTVQNRGKNRPWEQNLPPRPRPWRKQAKEPARVAGTADYCEEPGRHLYSLPVDTKMNSRPVSCHNEILCNFFFNIFFYFYCENPLKYKLQISEKTQRVDEGKNI